MTTEEFTGHLLAALHGPKADEVVSRIIVVAGVDSLIQMVFALTLRALAVDNSGQTLAGRDSAVERMRRISQKIAMGETVRGLAREHYGDAMEGEAMEGLLDD